MEKVQDTKGELRAGFEGCFVLAYTNQDTQWRDFWESGQSWKCFWRCWFMRSNIPNYLNSIQPAYNTKGRVACQTKLTAVSPIFLFKCCRRQFPLPPHFQCKHL